MPRRSMVIFWTAVSVSVLLLGSGVATLRRVIGGGDTEDYVALAITVFGLCASLLVAGRIALVVARVQRAARAE